MNRIFKNILLGTWLCPMFGHKSFHLHLKNLYQWGIKHSQLLSRFDINPNDMLPINAFPDICMRCGKPIQ